MIRVLIVDDHDLVRRGLNNLLSLCKRIKVVGEASDGYSAIKLASELKPDIILLDIKMPGLDGLSIIKRFSETNLSSRIIILSAYDNEKYVLDAIRYGAYAYLLKNSSEDILVESIIDVYEGKKLLSPKLMETIFEEFQQLTYTLAEKQSALSGEEIMLLSYLAEGLSTNEISQEICCSERTVKRKITKILDELGASNRTHAVAIGVQRGLVKISE